MYTIKQIQIAAATIFFGSFLLAGNASAVIIDFDAFTPGAFASGVEDGFNITVSTNGSIFATPDCGTNCAGATGVSFDDPFFVLQRTDGGSFLFESLDLMSGGVGPGHDVVGFLDGVLQAADQFLASGGFPLTTFPAANLAGVKINALAINLAPGVGADASPQALDNIVLTLVPLTPVPEPATIALVGAGLFGIACRKRKTLSA